MKQNDTIHGFRITDIRRVEQQNSTVIFFTHEETGAKGMKLQNDDANKAFGIGFRTPPTDSTGVAHILEHCVLGGSRKYRTREPFMDLIKSSLQTFLNAMTFPDKTVYPIASRNETDFHNLIDVYLDGVLHPLVLEKKEIFDQEGWTLRLDEDGLSYNGVVYNEMKGAMSGAEEQVLEEAMQRFAPDSTYSHNSGGDPYAIPSLTFEDFKAFHARYYHPSNSFLFFYGNGDLERELAHVQEFFADFSKRDPDSEIVLPKPFATPESTSFRYHIAKSENAKNKDYIGTVYATGDATDAEAVFLNSILEEIFLNSSASPLRRALQEVSLGENLLSTYNEGRVLNFGVIAKNTDAKREAEFHSILERVFRDVAENDVDPELLDAALNKLEFSLQEGPSYSATGVVRFLQVLSSWLYDGDPLMLLEFAPTFDALREKLKNGYLKERVRTLFLENPNRLEFTALPQPGLFEEKDAVVAEALQQRFESMTEEEKEALYEENERLAAYQEDGDSPEAKATIPRLRLSDLSPSVERVPQHITGKDGMHIVHNDVFTGRIVYLDLLFDLSHLTEDELLDVAQVASFLSDVDTSERPYDQVSNAVYRAMGSLSITPVVGEHRVTGKPQPKLHVSAKFFADRQKEAMAILREVLLQSRMDDPKRLKDVLLEDQSSIQGSLLQEGHRVASDRVASYVNPAAYLRERISGLDNYFDLQETIDRFDEESDRYIARWNALYEKMFTKRNLYMGITTQKEQYDELLPGWEPLWDALPDRDDPPVAYTMPRRQNEAFTSAASVQYVSKGADVAALGFVPTGKWQVLTNLLSIDYLHNRIRAIGGAYGAGIRITSRGLLSTYSYRDPQLASTLEAYDEAGAFLRELDLSDEERENLIIGTINRFDPPLTARGKGIRALTMLAAGDSFDRVETELADALSTTREDLQQAADLLDAAMRENKLCVLGSEEAIAQNADRFDAIIPLDYDLRTRNQE